MRSVIDYFIKNEIAGNILMILIFIVGLFGLNQMKTTFFPEVASRIISIQAIYPGSSPDEVEEGIVSKIEENLKGLTGIERVTSVSSENSANITVEVLKGFDTETILQDVKNAIDRVSSFPVDMEPLIVYKQENLGFAINFAISGDVPLKTLKQIARQAEDDIRALDDVSKVTLAGFPDEEIEITFREEDLRANNITFAEAATRIRQTNLEITGGTIKTNTEELLIRANNKEYTASALQDIVIKTNQDGGVIRLYQIADVQDRWADSPQRTYVDGNPAVVVNVQNTLEEDMLDVTDKVKVYLEEFAIKFPEVKATVLRDGSVTLRQRIDLLTTNGVTGFIIVLLLLAMFLHYRLAFWVALAIPISFAGMFLFASMIGITINVISLFGMIIVIGILVDDGIVIAENIYQHYEDGEPAFKAALNGTMEVLPAVFSAILTTVIAFSAFFFIDGRLGDIFREMAIVVIFSLVFSLIEGALILPAHIAHSKALSKDRKPNLVMRSLDKMMVFLKDNLYGPVLNWAVKFNWPTLAICFAGLFIVGGAFMGGMIKSTFFPVIPRENFQVQLKMAAGTREDITLEIMNSIENAILEVNQELKDEYFNGEINPIENIQKTIGPTSYQADLNVSLLEGETRGDVSAGMIIAKIREKVGPLPMVETFTFGSGSPFGKPLSLSLLGDDGDQLTEAVKAVKASLEKIPDLKDIVDNNQEGLKEIELELKPKAYNLGFTLNDIIGQVRQGFFGAEAQRIQRGEDEVRIWVRYGEEDRSDISDLADMRIRTSTGQSIPLRDLADFKTERGIVNINRIEGSREVRIEGDVANDEVSISDITSDVKNVILPQVLRDFPGVVASFEGQEREQAKTMDSMKLVMPIILLMMFFVIVLTFKSVSQALIVFSLLPFGFIGVGVGHYIHGLPISLFSILGVIALVGIFVNDALVFITAFNERIKAGVPHVQAVIETGKSRFRPILLTSITTIAGLAPLILEKSFQAQFLIPMAISVAYGLLFGTFILLVLIPALLMITNRIKRTAMQAYGGEKVSRESVEPAYPGKESNFLVYLIAGLIAIFLFGALVYGLFQFSSVFA
ncbi:efflux RND transporter permease subunit [Portibacter lacus]|uniref:Multidrug transporter AcrB n=1 Tax=Portibacter lacus TaxID=1099794 RepID=A0AA37SSM3_9BACT|nr:efflux RND transporter permease subunit [Portibacter lacus]GLR18799.1 multidrug transporter AcrB [Portibacter lacus]